MSVNFPNYEANLKVLLIKYMSYIISRVRIPLNL